MATNVYVTKQRNDNNTNLVRKFSRQFRSTGIVQTVRGNRYFKRKPSALRKKNSALVRIARGIEYARMRKLGKLVTKKRGGRR